MIKANHKPIIVIGYQQSSMTHEFLNSISKTHSCTVVEPDQYMDLPNKQDYQFIVASWINHQSRRQILAHIDQFDLDLVTYIDDTSVVDGVVEPGSFVFPFCKISLKSTVGRHCIIGEYSLIGHYAVLGKGCVIRPGVIIVDKSTIGTNCIINLRSTVCNSVHVCDDTVVLGYSSVTKHITESGIYIGTPARKKLG
jgi:UDP-N-acetylbacillosamine N-acetyltransferase